tara:strand:+ start:8064 stop:8726 length:663 start_codon:yes stop_codon:yes gene_type:complete
MCLKRNIYGRLTVLSLSMLILLCSCNEVVEIPELTSDDSSVRLFSDSSLEDKNVKIQERIRVQENSIKEPALDISDFPKDALVVDVISGNKVTVEITGTKQRHIVSYLGVNIPDGMIDKERSAFDLNKYLTLGKIVTVSDVDLYIDGNDQIHAYVFCDGEFINQVLIANGFALFGDEELSESRQSDLLNAQEEARARGMGLWEGFQNARQSGCGTLPCFK